MKQVVVSLVVFSLLNAGCATRMVPVTGTDEMSVSITVAVGDTVRVLTKYGDRPIFQVTDINSDALIGKDQQIHFADMAFVEKQVPGRPRDGEPSALAVVLLVAASTVTVMGLKRVGPGFPSDY